MAHVRQVARLPQVEVRVLPFAAGWHPARWGGFTVLDKSDPADPDVVSDPADPDVVSDPADPDVAYVESVDGARYRELEPELRHFRDLFEGVRERSIPLEEFA